MSTKPRQVIILGMLLLAACVRGGELSAQSSDEIPAPATVMTPLSTESAATSMVVATISPPMEEPSSTPELVLTAVEPQPTPAGSGLPPVLDLPPQTNAAEIRPPERRKELTLLSNLLGYHITDINGLDLGIALDYVINTCETYILYISIDPAEGINDQAGMRMMLPFEIVTINSGVLDAEAGEIELYLPLELFLFGPVYAETMDLTPTDWESGVRDFWNQYVRISGLTTACMVTDPGTGNLVPVYKTAYASDLLGAALRDSLENDLGTVVEAIFEPESGKLGFYVVELIENQGLTLVPLGATNIPKQVLDSGEEISLVLLKDNEKLFNAPRFDSVEEATSDSAIGEARAYW